MYHLKLPEVWYQNVKIFVVKSKCLQDLEFLFEGPSICVLKYRRIKPYNYWLCPWALERCSSIRRMCWKMLWCSSILKCQFLVCHFLNVCLVCHFQSFQAKYQRNSLTTKYWWSPIHSTKTIPLSVAFKTTVFVTKYSKFCP